MPATMDAGTAIPGAPVIKPMSRMSNPAPIVHIGQVKLLSSQSCTAGTWRGAHKPPPKRIKKIPRIRLERFCLIAFLLLIDQNMKENKLVHLYSTTEMLESFNVI